MLERPSQEYPKTGSETHSYLVYVVEIVPLQVWAWVEGGRRKKLKNTRRNKSSFFMLVYISFFGGEGQEKGFEVVEVN